MISTQELETLPRLDVRVPRWPLETLQVRDCPLCGIHNEPALLRPDNLPVAHCNTCSIWYVCRIPPAACIQEFYNHYWHEFRPRPMGHGEAQRMLRSAPYGYRKDVRIQRLRALTGDLRGRRLIDIGCGLGQFLLLAREAGASVVGQEISPEACSFIRDYLQLTVHEGPLECCSKNMERADMIVLNDVVEHPTQPLQLFRAAYEILNDGGLLMIWTPNGGAAGATTKTAREWVGFRVDLEHLQYFSTSTIISLAAQHGWIVEHLETLGYASLDSLSREDAILRSHRAGLLRQAIHAIPGAYGFVHRMRAATTDLISRPQNSTREGTYHLLAILRKTEIPTNPPCWHPAAQHHSHKAT
jgi:SAM-dependent methyltransferase